MSEIGLAAMTASPDPQPALAMPPRPRRPLATWQLIRTFPDNAVAVCDEELFEELVVERRFPWGRVFVISDPEGIHHILFANPDNYVRIPPVRRAFAFTSGGGMNHLEGEDWYRHRRMVNPALEHRAILADLPETIRLTEEMAEHLLALPSGQQFEIGRTLTHLITRTKITGRSTCCHCRAGSISSTAGAGPAPGWKNTARCSTSCSPSGGARITLAAMTCYGAWPPRATARRAGS